MSIVIQFESNCNFHEIITRPIDTEIIFKETTIIQTTANQEEFLALRENECVRRIATTQQLEEILPSLSEDLQEDLQAFVEEHEAKKSIQYQDISDEEGVTEYLEEENIDYDEDPKVISPYQLYVTPNAPAVNDIAKNINGVQQAYDEALQWVWVSEQTLNGVIEFWYRPQAFLTLTPDLNSNPAPGSIASDCSEQANTLASVLIADGMDPKHVRVTLGLVDFGGEIGGHAWVEIYEDGIWFPIDATAGAYYDETTRTLHQAQDVPYQYFKFVPFPVEETWMYYNNEYFWDVEQKEGNAPALWI